MAAEPYSNNTQAEDKIEPNSGVDYKDEREEEQVTVIEGATNVNIVPRENMPRTINLNQTPALPGV